MSCWVVMRVLDQGNPVGLHAGRREGWRTTDPEPVADGGPGVG